MREFSWIWVQTAEHSRVREAVLEHSLLAIPVKERLHNVTLFEVSEGGTGIVFDPPIQPYDFCNLIEWIDHTFSKSIAVGWLISPLSGEKFFLTENSSDRKRESLIGAGSQGTHISVSLLDGSISRIAGSSTETPEPDSSIETARVLASFQAVFDSDESFGNPTFAITDK